MKILFAGHKERGVKCFEALVKSGHEIVGVIAHPSKEPPLPGSVAAKALDIKSALFQPEDVNDVKVISSFKALAPDIVALAGYSQIVGPDFIGIPRLGCVNLHGGKLPQYRGSSPMNWALINGEKEFSISVIQVNQGVDTGDVLGEKNFPIGPDDTIADLKLLTDKEFPKLLVEVIDAVSQGCANPRRQNENEAAYYPLRFPDDGFILWDRYTAAEIHNRVRALTEPFPCAFTFYNGRKIKLLKSKLAKNIFYGEPGRVYLKNENGLLVAAKDRALWIERAVFEDNGEDAVKLVNRYEKFSTLTGIALTSILGQERQ